MPALKEMEGEYPVLDSHFLRFCASHNILTVEDFLLHDVDVLYASTKHHPNSDRLYEGVTQVMTIIKGQHRGWSSGLELLEDATRNKRVLPTGFDSVDALLGGGLREGQLTELVGPSSSGKTQVCLKVASSVASKRDGVVVYLDTSNSFSPNRIEHFLVSDLGSDQVLYRNELVKKVMRCIMCHSVFDIFAMFDVLHQLEISLRSQEHGLDSRVCLLVIDSISSLVTPVLGGNNPQGHALMVSGGFLLKKLAHEHNIAVLVTNHMVAGEGGSIRPALGESWKSVSHVRLLLTPTDHGTGASNLCVLKHPSAAGSTAKLIIA